MAALFRQIGRGKVHGDAVVGQRKPDGVQGGAHTLARFAHRLVGETDDVERTSRGGALSDVHLHIDFAQSHGTLAQLPGASFYHRLRERFGRLAR